MPNVVEGQLTSDGFKVAIIAARFNAFVVDRLVDGAVEALERTGCKGDDITVYRAPGAFEIPQVLRRVVELDAYDAVVCLGAVIRGGTPHFEYISSAVTRGINGIALTASVPIAFGVLTCDTADQAMERAGTTGNNKGAEAAMAAVEMVNLLRKTEK